MSQEFNPDAFRANLDQGGAAMRDLAVTIAGFWKAMIASGMTDVAATAVTCQWVASLLLQQKGQQ